MKHWILIALLVLTPLVALSQEAEAQQTATEITSGFETAAHEGEAEHAEGDNVTFWKTINFALLAAGLFFLLRKPAKAYFTSATAKIREGIDTAAAEKASAEARAAEMATRLNNLETEIASLREHAAEEMRAEDERLRKQGEHELARVQERAKQEIASAATQAKNQLRAEAAKLAMDLAQEKVRARMTPEVSGQLVDSFVADLGELARRQS